MEPPEVALNPGETAPLILSTCKVLILVIIYTDCFL